MAGACDLAALWPCEPGEPFLNARWHWGLLLSVSSVRLAGAEPVAQSPTASEPGVAVQSPAANTPDDTPPRPVALPSQVQEQRVRTDGVYGRFDGDLALGAHLGAELGADEAGAKPHLRVSASYYQSLGLVLALTPRRGERAPTTLGAALEVTPLFLPRWVLDLEQGPPLIDLIVDSVAVSGLVQVDAGAQGVAPRFALGGGLGVPLQQDAQGFWLLMRAHAPVAGQGAATLTLTLGYTGFVETELVKSP